MLTLSANKARHATGFSRFAQKTSACWQRYAIKASMKILISSILLLVSGISFAETVHPIDSAVIGSWSTKNNGCSALITFQPSGEFNSVVNDSSAQGSYELSDYKPDFIVTREDGKTLYCAENICRRLTMTTTSFVKGECLHTDEFNLIDEHPIYIGKDGHLIFELNIDAQIVFNRV